MDKEKMEDMLFHNQHGNISETNTRDTRGISAIKFV